MIQDESGGIDVLDVDAALAATLRLDPAATREAVTRYIQEIEEMSQVLDRVEPPTAFESIAFSAAWPAVSTNDESE